MNGKPLSVHDKRDVYSAGIYIAFRLGMRKLTLWILFLFGSSLSLASDCDRYLKQLAQDEGMWLINRPPLERLERFYNFKPSQEWLKKAQRASVKVGSGGSGAFVSSQGLVLTNHHVVADHIEKLSTAEKDLIANGFVARDKNSELPLPNLEIKRLVNIRNVTRDVLKGITLKTPELEAAQIRRANIAKLEASKTNKKSEVVELYLGGEFHLYTYDVYNDVRLAFAPERSIATFGGDAANFEFPRYNLDMALLRVYGNDGKPLKVKDFFGWSKKGPEENELVFVTGHPGSTSRLFTMAALEFVRDVQLPARLLRIGNMIRRLQLYSSQSGENRRKAEVELYSYQNSFKVLSGDARGLGNSQMMADKKKEEENLKSIVTTDKKLKGAENAWDQVQKIEREKAKTFWPRYLLTDGVGFETQLFDIARIIVRMAMEDTKPETERLPFYRASRRASLEHDLYSQAPIYKDFEEEKLAESLTLLVQKLESQPRLLDKIFGGRTPKQAATYLIRNSNLDDVSFRRSLAGKSFAAIKRSTDPLIKLALLVDPISRKLGDDYRINMEGPLQDAYRKIAQAKFSIYGDLEYPDATSTLRLAFGRVTGYVVEDQVVPPWTVARGIYDVANEHLGEADWELPDSWKNGDLLPVEPLPFNFVSTADTIGGNSGSPVINRAGEVVGLNFDSNSFKIEKQRYQYSDDKSRHISVDSGLMRSVLASHYGASHLAEELGK